MTRLFFFSRNRTSAVFKFHVRQTEVQRTGASAGVRLPGRGNTRGAAGIARGTDEPGFPGHLQRSHGPAGAAETAEVAAQDETALQPSGDASI